MKAWCHNCAVQREVPFRARNERCGDCGFTLVDPPRERKSLSRDASKGLRSKPGSLRQRPPRRDWVEARAKVELEGRCRFCGEEFPDYLLHACHVIGRDRDQFHPVTFEPQREPWLVVPDRIVPGCEPCHTAYDAHEVGLIGRLTLEEEVQAVRDSFPPTGRGSGIEHVRQRCDPVAYRRDLAA